MEKIGERLEILRTRLGINHQEFAALAGISVQSVKKIREGGGTKTEVLQSLAENVKDLNFNWLITGKGEMFTFQETSKISEPAAPYSEVITPLKNWESIARLYGEIENMKEDMSSLRILVRNTLKVG